ncbi:MORN variant repeat protein [Frankia sp. AgKG'84/4]
MDESIVEQDPARTVSIDDIDYTDDLFVVYEGKLFTGRVIDRYKDGQICKIDTYRKGRPNGLERSYFPDGSIESEHWHEDGGWHGTGRTWFPDGKLESETLYNHGEVVHEKRWSEDGTELN